VGRKGIYSKDPADTDTEKKEKEKKKKKGGTKLSTPWEGGKKKTGPLHRWKKK